MWHPLNNKEGLREGKEHHKKNLIKKSLNEENTSKKSNMIQSTYINMSHIQGAIEDLARRYMEGQEQQLHFQSQMMNHQARLHKQQMEQQQEHYSRLAQTINQVSERQERQDKCLQELNQRQLAQMKAFNKFNVLNEGRQLHREEYDVNTQAKLTYMAGHMHNLYSAIPRYDTVHKDLKEQEEEKVKQQKETLKKKMENASFWKKLIEKHKRSGDSSNQEGTQEEEGNKGT
ncbi:uncharacterized protein LOC130933895 [Arachis stenosperma]|uniref:uncharacterized protein LOC130933895 n=1 Tax=Arachis stenosperma TaxID=217475 RepID=UPI0025AB9934|nr:uncharacterized protein LOC130933895 [Arachis stenosperma]